MDIYVPSRDPRGQIKTRQRVRDLAEVFTHEREVKAMLDLVPDMFPSSSIKTVEMKFLEPACGSGNFLEEIFRRKLAGIRFGKVKSASRYEHWLLRALASIYGVDISLDNVEESRVRLLEVLRSHYHNDANTMAPSAGFASAARAIVTSNMIHTYGLSRRAHNNVAIKEEHKINRPPIVGVPAFFKWVSGPSLRIGWPPTCTRLSRRMNG